jgi:hypothetical protein
VTAKISINVPASPQSTGDASAGVSDAVRRAQSEARCARRRQAAQAHGEYLRGRAPERAKPDRDLIESSNDIALHDARW